MEVFNVKKFYNEENLSSMKLNDEISMDFIYENLKNVSSLEQKSIKILNKKKTNLIYILKI